MTRSALVRQTDDASTLQEAFILLQQKQKERILRELRYVPDFSGEMTFTLKFKKGVPFAYREHVEHNQLTSIG